MFTKEEGIYSSWKTI